MGPHVKIWDDRWTSLCLSCFAGLLKVQSGTCGERRCLRPPAAPGTQGPSSPAGPRAGKAPRHGCSCWHTLAQVDSCPSRPQPAGDGSGQGPWPGAGPRARLPFKGNLGPAPSPPHLALPLPGAPGAALGQAASVAASTGLQPERAPQDKAQQLRGQLKHCTAAEPSAELFGQPRTRHNSTAASRGMFPVYKQPLKEAV